MVLAWDNKLHGFSASWSCRVVQTFFRFQEASHLQIMTLGKASAITFACSRGISAALSNVDADALVHSPTNIWLATMWLWWLCWNLDPALHPQIGPKLWNSRGALFWVFWPTKANHTCSMMPLWSHSPEVPWGNLAGSVHALQKAARQPGRSQQYLAKKGGVKDCVEEATVQRRSWRSGLSESSRITWQRLTICDSVKMTSSAIRWFCDSVIPRTSGCQPDLTWPGRAQLQSYAAQVTQATHLHYPRPGQTSWARWHAIVAPYFFATSRIRATIVAPYFFATSRIRATSFSVDSYALSRSSSKNLSR